MEMSSQRMNDGRFLTVVILISALLSISAAGLLLPTLLTGDQVSEQIKTTTLAKIWKESRIELPRFAKWSLIFAEEKSIRVLSVLMLFIINISSEALVKSRKIAGCIHLFSLFAGVIIGWLFLFSLSLPYAPL